MGGGAVEPGGSDEGMTVMIATFSPYTYVYLQSWMNVQLRHHLSFPLLSLLCHYILYPIVPCAISPFPRTSNAILYLLDACRDNMVFLPCCVPTLMWL